MFTNHSNEKINKCLSFTIIITILLLLSKGIVFSKIDSIILLETTAIIFISLFFMLRELWINPFSLNMMHWIFIFIFMGITPLIQISNNFAPWGFTFSTKNHQIGLLFVILWIIAYIIGSFLPSINLKHPFTEIQFKKKNYFLFLSLACTIAIIFILSIGFLNLFSRATSNFSFGSLPIDLIINKGGHAIIVFLSLFTIYLWKLKKYKIYYLIIPILLLLLICFPTSLARFESGLIYIAIFIAFFYKFFANHRKYNLVFFFLFLLGFMIGFPLINVFRRMTFSEVNLIKTFTDIIDDLSGVYLAEDYDAYSLLLHTINYVENYGITFGRQLLGVLFFFIPRTIWINKPIGSGHTIFSIVHPNFTNVSCPLMAEGYINFGLFGIIIFGLFFGYTSTLLNKMYWDDVVKQTDKITFIKLIYPCLLGGYFFMMRGDLMSSWAYIIAYVVIFIIACLWMNYERTAKERN